MNLIEQLGGYAQAKNYAVDANACGAFDDEKKIKSVLIEYCRQHNIFEVGDDVVLIGGNCTLIYKLHERIGKYVYLKRPSGREYDFHIDEIRHATEAEIQAGKRL